MHHRVSADPVRFRFDTPHVATVTVRKAGVPRCIVKVIFERRETPSKAELYRVYQRNVDQATDKEGLDAALRFYVRHHLWDGEPQR